MREKVIARKLWNLRGLVASIGANTCVLSHFNPVQLFETLWTRACQPPLSMGFPRQEYWSGLPFPPPGDLPDPAIEPATLMLPVLEGGFFTTSSTWEALIRAYIFQVFLLTHAGPEGPLPTIAMNRLIILLVSHLVTNTRASVIDMCSWASILSLQIPGAELKLGKAGLTNTNYYTQNRWEQDSLRSTPIATVSHLIVMTYNGK